MKILIDENLPRKLAAYLEGHEWRTVVECWWSGKKNGELLALAIRCLMFR
jgi:predicted nuclease of predicted toxin-antitoxin system